MDGADSGARKHGNRGLGNQRHVNQDAVPLLDAVALENVRKKADLAVQLPVGDHPLLTRLPLPDDRGLVGAGCVKMAVEAVEGSVEFTSDKPLGVGKFPIQYLGPFFRPMKLGGFPAPEIVRTLQGLGVELPVLGKTADPGFF